MNRFGRDPVEREARAWAAERGERASAAALTDDGVRVLTTGHALYFGETRWPWDRIVKATWDTDEQALSVTGSAVPGEPARIVVLALSDATRLLEIVRSEVTSNLLVAQRIDSVEHGGAWVSARRVPGSDEIRWSVVFDPGRDPDDPGRRAWADANVAALRRSTGV